jgi:hypothetical protein
MEMSSIVISEIMAKRKKPAYSSKEELVSAVKESRSLREVLSYLGLGDGNGNYKRLKYHLEFWSIDISHFENPRERSLRLRQEKGSKGFRPIPLENILVKDSSYRHTDTLKKRLYKAGLKEPKCEMEGCGQTEKWLGKHMSLILDHINGDPTDNRFENLRILCPNCNATLPTHCGKRRVKECVICNAEFVGPNQVCSSDCAKTLMSLRASLPRIESRKATRPPQMQLLKELESSNWAAVGRKYGVTDNAIRKWVRFYGLDPKSIKTKRPPGGKKLEVPLDL